MAWREHERLIRVFGALLAPTLAGCGSKVEDSIETAQFTEDLCRDGQAFPLAHVQPAMPVDYMEQRVAYQRGYDPVEFSDPGGAPNQSAKSAAEPPTRTRATRPLTGCRSTPRSTSARVSASPTTIPWRSPWATRPVRFAASPSFVRSLGPIDAPGDAVLLARFERYSVMYQGDNNVGEHPEGYVVHVRQGDGCLSDLNEHVLLVREDGTIEITATELITPQDPRLRDRADARGAAGRTRAGRAVSPGPDGSSPTSRDSRPPRCMPSPTWLAS